MDYGHITSEIRLGEPVREDRSRFEPDRFRHADESTGIRGRKPADGRRVEHESRIAKSGAHGRSGDKAEFEVSMDAIRQATRMPYIT